MQLFYIPGITPPQAILPEEESAHCMKVLRLGRGDTVHVTDGEGRLYTATIERPDPKHCVIEITDVEENYGKRPYSLTVAIAPTKNTDRYEWFLEKATETGIDRIIPIECRRSERRILKRDRGERIVTSAMKQSLKAFRPALDELTPLEEILHEPFEGIKMIAHCDADFPRSFIGDVIRPGSDCMILIGPEGDFSPEEIRLAEQAGFVSVSLGESRLRTETAALATVTVTAFVNNTVHRT